MLRAFLLLISCLMAFSPTQAGERLYKSTTWIKTDKAIIQGLDKVSARVFTAEVNLNQKVHFGSLEVFVRSCNRAPPEEQPETICFLEIFDNKPGQQRQQVFSGWMFASNPALSALEHPVYDIWIKEEVVSTPEPSGKSKASQKAANRDEEIEEDVSRSEDIKQPQSEEGPSEQGENLQETSTPGEGEKVKEDSSRGEETANDQP